MLQAEQKWEASFDCFWPKAFGRLMLQIITTQLFLALEIGFDNWTGPDSLSYHVSCNKVHMALPCHLNNTLKISWISSQLTALALSSAVRTSGIWAVWNWYKPGHFRLNHVLRMLLPSKDISWYCCIVVLLPVVSERNSNAGMSSLLKFHFFC